MEESLRFGKSLDDEDDKWTVLSPMSQPDVARPTLPPNERPSICSIQYLRMNYYSSRKFHSTNFKRKSATHQSII